MSGVTRRQFLQASTAIVLGGCSYDLRVTPTSRDKLQDLCARILKMSPADETLLRLTISESALSRFANNQIHQNVSETLTRAELTPVVGGRATRVTTNRLDDASLKETIDLGLEMAKRQKPIRDYQPMLGPQEVRPADRYDAATARATPEDRARHVGRALEVVKKSGLEAAGMLQTSGTTTALANTRGLFVSHRESLAAFSATVLSDDSSGWAQSASYRLDEVDTEQLAERATRKAVDSRKPDAVEPGKYVVVLEPAAVSDLMSFLLGAFSAQNVAEKRSFFTDKLGTKVFGENITIVDDAHDPRHFGTPFDGEGMPKSRLVLVENGVLKNLVVDRLTAKRTGARPTGHGGAPPDYGAWTSNFILKGGTETPKGLLAGVQRGVLVTHFWYIRFLDSFRLTVTGMTRDGTFLIEDGKITRGLRNMRFNISLADLLNNVEAMTPEVRASGIEAGLMLCPGMRVRDFHFTSVTLY